MSQTPIKVDIPERVKTKENVNKAISTVLNKDPSIVNNYKKLAIKIRDDFGLKISNDEIEEYFEPDIESEMSTLANYYTLLNMNY